MKKVYSQSNMGVESSQSKEMVFNRLSWRQRVSLSSLSSFSVRAMTSFPRSDAGRLRASVTGSPTPIISTRHLTQRRSLRHDLNLNRGGESS